MAALSFYLLNFINPCYIGSTHRTWAFVLNIELKLKLSDLRQVV